MKIWNNRRKFGQHFLIKKDVVERILDYSGNIDNHHIVEIGPGKGILTEEILSRKPLSLISIEIDNKFANKHLSFVKAFPHYNIIMCDVMKVDLQSVTDNPKKIIANIPYSISSNLIHKIISVINNFVSVTLMLQMEVAHKIMSISRLGIFVSMRANVRYLFDVDKECFSPVPKVQSAVVLITPKSIDIEERHCKNVENVTNVLLNQKNKMLKSNLKILFTRPEVVLNELNIDGSRRVGSLSFNEFFDIVRKVEDIES